MIAYLDLLFFRLSYFLKYGRPRPAHEVEIRRLYLERLGFKRVRRSEHYSVLSYERGGVFDHELYKKIQILGNKGKIRKVFVQEDNIRFLCREIEKVVPSIDFVLCHGTRNGAEQKFFLSALSKPAAILGTEISDNAAAFPMTIEWDFHEVKPEWLGAVDVIYSNSWDHSYDPRKLFEAWLSCLRTGGVMALEWSLHHGGRRRPNILDPTNIPLESLLKLLDEMSDKGRFWTLPVLNDPPVSDSDQKFVLVQRLA
jgi:SAM-dependent methyltransferase